MSQATDIRVEVEELATRFHILYYNMFGWGERAFNWNKWRGVTVRKAPEDLWRYQQIIFDTKPELIIETGIAYGGSTLWFADVCNLLGAGHVVACDIGLGGARAIVREHPRVTLIEGDSTSPEVFGAIERMAAGKRTLVSLDSDHHKAHVLREMELYGALVSLGGYMVVEDTNINGHPVVPAFGPGPHEAVEQYLATHPGWRRDREIERSMLTFNPGGYLVRTAC